MDIITKTKSICPVCRKVVEAELFKKGETIFMKKTCPTCGEFTERITDLKTFDRDYKYLQLLYKYIPSKDIPKCPYSCEGCVAHRSPTVLGIIDVTNRCNLRCSYCFANASVSGKLFEPSLETLKKEIDFLVNQSPPTPAVLFSGGEPTIREDFLELVRYASSKNMFILVATNGYKIASSLEYTKSLSDAGASIIYLSFDGLTDETNTEKKNHLLIDKIIDHCRKAKLGIVLVPTIIRGLNDNQIWPIIRFASQHMDVIAGVNFQPISFSGRMSDEQRTKERFTISDLKQCLEKQSNGFIKVKNWFPVPVVLPFTKLFEKITGNKGVTFSSHPLCGEATYLFRDNKGRLIPIPEFIDVEKFVDILEKRSSEMRGGDGAISKSMKMLSMIHELFTTIDLSKVSYDSDILNLIKAVILKPGDIDTLAKFHTRTLFIGSMHFQDLYNFDIERVKYCTIHYVTPDMTKIPFCAYNALGYRENVEQRHTKQL